ncbi:hypothetical protein AB0I52_10015 [Streptomyces sp. NPDC050423]|uniref:hypothetical protein n=1 Tax=Streptomyces sp. NPDC050423 TaxID=3155402 RepID=UPI0034414995
MSEQHDVVQPGIDPAGLSTAGPMFAAFHGELVPHPWRDPESEHDAYQLFHQRSIAMGWLDEQSSAARDERASKAPGLWAMNNAFCSTRHAAAEPFARFQVECSMPANDRPLPVQPFLRCAEDTTARIGTAHLSAVQLLLPLQGIDPASRPRNALVPSMETCDWFGEHAPQAQTPVKVTIDSGRTPSIPAIAQQLVRLIGHLQQDAFIPGKSGRADEDETLPPPFADGFWNGPPLHGMTLRGELAEWSCDAVGWLAATIADSASHLGVRTPLLLSVVRG